MGSWAPTRVQQPELMDDPSLPRADHLCALDALSTINFFSRTSSQLAAAVARLAAASGRSAKVGDPLKVVDVACGGGDVTVEVTRKLARRGFSVDMLGIDKSSLAIARARRRVYSLPEARVEFEQADVLARDTPPCDIAISSLFLHHLEVHVGATKKSTLLIRWHPELFLLISYCMPRHLKNRFYLIRAL